MIITGTAATVYSRATARPHLRVELLSASNGLDRGSPGETRRPTVNRRAEERPHACHFETRCYPGLMDSRLNSAFVAQILGQDLVTKRADGTLGGRIYAQAQREAPVQRLLRLV
jgi:hypothetical protein